MVQGLDRREVVQDVNKPQPLQPSNVPLAPIQSPRPSSFKRVGENEQRLTEAFGKFPELLSQYVEKKKPEWELEGMMAYAEAATESDIVAKGNKHITAGYMTMKARTANLEWLAQQQVDLENDDTLKAMDSASYQKYLMDSFRPMQQAIAGKDPFTNELLMAMSADNFPRLVSQQIVKNNAYVEQQTEQAYVDYAAAAMRRYDSPDADEGAEEEVLHLLSPGASGLRDRAKERKLQTSALESVIKLGNTRVQELVGGSRGAPRASENYSRSLLDFVRQYEAGSRGHDAVNSQSGGTDLVPTRMTLGQIKEWQAARIKAGAKSVAIGGYQFNHVTLKETQAAMGLSDDTVFDAEVQDKMAAHLMKPYMDQYLKDGDADKFLYGLSGRWAALPKDSSGESYYEGKNGNRALVSYDDTMSLITQVPKEIHTTDNMAALGFSLEDQLTIKQALSQANQERTAQFADTRLNAEQDIQQTALTTGNEAEVRRKIKQYQEENGYTDVWANGVYNSAGPLMEKYQKNQLEVHELQVAVQNNTVRHLTPEKKDKAFDYILAQGVANLQNSGLDPAQQEEAIKDYMLDASIRLGTLDRYTDGWMKTALSGTVVDKEGKVRSDTLKAYQSWMQVYHTDKKLAQQYAGDKQELLYEAMVNDQYQDGSEQAITKAAQLQQRLDDGWTPPDMDDKQLDKTLQKALEKRRVGLWDRLIPGASERNASDRGWFTFNRQPTPAQERMVKNDALLQPTIMRRANNLLKYRDARTPEAAIEMATDQVMAESVIIGGNVIPPPMNSRQPTFLQAAGLEGKDLKINEIHEAFIDYMNAPSDDDPTISRGEQEYGKAWNKIEVWDWGTFIDGNLPANAGAMPGVSKRLGQSTAEWTNGMPEGSLIDYNYDTREILFRIPQEVGSNKMHNNVIAIPAAVLGQHVLYLGETRILKEND